jgi:hypothetical protein
MPDNEMDVATDGFFEKTEKSSTGAVSGHNGDHFGKLPHEHEAHACFDLCFKKQQVSQNILQFLPLLALKSLPWQFVNFASVDSPRGWG